MSLDLTARGARLALSDVDSAGLAETVRKCPVLDVEVTADHLDVAEPVSMMSYAEVVVAPASVGAQWSMRR
ncbi:MAG: hypothetical protein ACXVXW_08490, partial [Mycobacteriaceae bacterium]